MYLTQVSVPYWRLMKAAEPSSDDELIFSTVFENSELLLIARKKGDDEFRDRLKFWEAWT